MVYRLKSFTLAQTLITFLMLSLWVFQSHLFMIRYHQLMEINREKNLVQHELIQVLSTINQGESLNDTTIIALGFLITNENEMFFMTKDRLTIEYNSLTQKVNVIWFK